MKISVQVKANSRQERIEKITAQQFNVWVREPAKEGKANLAVIEALSGYFGIAKSRITILKGHSGKNKLIEIS